MSASDRISVRPMCFGAYTPVQRADRACGSCKSSADCISPMEELTMAGEKQARGAFAAQVGGSHYKSMAIQPAEYCHLNGIGKLEGDVIAYVSRWRAKNGVEDLKKARHTLDLMIEMEERAK